jgi:hypothetical protein
MSIYGEMPASSNYTGYYHLSDRTDYSGNGRNLTAGDGTFNTPARFGGGVQISPGTGYVMYPSNPGMDGTNITMSVWFKYASNSHTDGQIFEVYDNTAHSQWVITYTNSGACNFRRGDIASFSDSAVYNYTLPTTSFTHLALTCDRTTIKGYLNGDLVVTKATSTVGNSTAYHSRINLCGYIDYDIPNRNRAYGTFDEAIVEKRVWSATEIKKYYELCKGSFGPATTMI